VFAVAKQYNLPIFVLLLDNTGWSAVKESTLRVFPEDEAKAAGPFQAGLMPDAEFAAIVLRVLNHQNAVGHATPLYAIGCSRAYRSRCRPGTTLSA
jgi:hypothetical protein